MKALHRYIQEQTEAARQEGVSLSENMPFWLPADKARTCVLLVHGFTASPWEMSHIAHHLSDRGLACLGVRLPGHGSTPERLLATGRQDWLNAVHQAAEAAQADGYRLAGVGSSTGALLLLRLCLDKPLLQRLALCSPFLRVRHRLAPLAGLLRFLRRYQHHPKPPEVAPYFYDRRPLAGVAEINRLIREIRPRLDEITQPCLVLASRGDETIDPASAEQLYERIGSRDKQFHMYGVKVPHVLVLPGHSQFDDVLCRIARFLEA